MSNSNQSNEPAGYNLWQLMLYFLRLTSLPAFESQSTLKPLPFDPVTFESARDTCSACHKAFRNT